MSHWVCRRLLQFSDIFEIDEVDTFILLRTYRIHNGEDITTPQPRYLVDDSDFLDAFAKFYFAERLDLLSIVHFLFITGSLLFHFKLA
jgi:hypothetical protein